MSWQLQVVGNIRLYDASKQPKPDRRTAAVLAYLALEGPTPRAKLAGLLWPDVADRPARNNLVQALRRLKKVTETDLVIGDDTLNLVDFLEVDIAKLNVLAFQSRYEELLTVTGELLPRDYDDLPEFSEWLLSQREKLSLLRREALTSVIRRDEKEGNYDVALRYAQTLLHLDVLDEDTYRLIMRLHYVTGNRAEAMKVFERCKSVLQKELGVEPSLETHKLAADIGFGTLELSPIKPKETTLPLSVLRPPLLIGREKEWTQLEEAWQEGKVIFIHGEPGSGKSRLMLDFVASKGEYALVDPRPGDEAVIYSTHARNMRRLMEQHPNEHIEPWVRTELSRLLPELSPEAPPAMKDETAKLRLFEAIAWMTFRHQALGIKAIVMDDMQFIDAGSLEMGNYLASKNALAPLHEQLPSLNAFRSNEISPQVETTIQNLVNTGMAVLIEVKPLNQDAIAELLESLGVPQFRNLTDRLSKYTGGNPFFILETLKNLLESGGDLSTFPVPNRVSALIQKRLDTLQPTSLKLARVAAVANTDFSPQLAENILRTDALELAEGFAELERLQVLRGNAFAHDLIYEATLASIPAPIKTLLHGRVAGWLEAAELKTARGNAARTADHWLAAGEDEKAIPKLLEAARNYQANFRYVEAVEIFDKTALLLEKQGNSQALFDVIYEQGGFVSGVDLSDKREEAIKKLFALAQTPEQKAKACEYAALYYLKNFDVQALEGVSQQGYDYATQAGDGLLQTFFLKTQSHVHWFRNDMQQGIVSLKPVLELAKKEGIALEVADIANTLGLMLGDAGEVEEAETYFLKAQEIYSQAGNTPKLADVFRNRAMAKNGLGLVREAYELSSKALSLLDKTSGSLETRILLEINCASYLRNLDEYSQSLDRMLNLQKAALADYGQSVFLSRELAFVYLRLGAIRESKELLQQALNSTRAVPLNYSMTQLYFISFLLTTGQYEGELDELDTPPEKSIDYLLWLQLRARQSQTLDDAKRLLELVRARKLHGQEIAALCLCAKACLETAPKKALGYSTQMIELMETYTSAFYKGDRLFTHYQVLAANKKREALPFLQTMLAWLLDVANNKVPPEYRERFLSHNLVNKAILDEVKQVGLEVPIP
jgi:DNA-binding SARP family transcriptional activator